MNIEWLREYCLAKPGAEETLPFGPDTLVFKTGGKAFLLTGLDSEELRFNVKCDPDKAIEPREKGMDRITGNYVFKPAIVQQLCGDTCATLFPGRVIIVRKTTDSLITVEFLNKL